MTSLFERSVTCCSIVLQMESNSSWSISSSRVLLLLVTFCDNAKISLINAFEIFRNSVGFAFELLATEDNRLIFKELETQWLLDLLRWNTLDKNLWSNFFRRNILKITIKFNLKLKSHVIFKTLNHFVTHSHKHYVWNGFSRSLSPTANSVVLKELKELEE